MVRKTKPAGQDTTENGQLAAAVKESASQIWLAGLGAFAKAQEEGGKGIQKRTREMAEERLGEVAGRFGKVAGGVSKQATHSWDRLEQVFEDRVARALNRLGVPTNADVQELIARVETLTASVQALGGKPARAPRAAAARKPAAKATKAASRAAPKAARKAARKAAQA
jgi:poly(hydroxyalkanoate) granule-associated protein